MRYPTFGYHKVHRSVRGREKLVSGARGGIMGLKEEGNNGKINERMKLTT